MSRSGKLTLFYIIHVTHIPKELFLVPKISFFLNIFWNISRIVLILLLACSAILRHTFNSTIFQHPDQKPGCRKFWRLSGFARSKRVGCVTCIWESYMEFPSLTIHLIHDVHASALWRSIRIFSFFSTLFVIEEVECVFTSFFHVKLLTVELWVSLNTLHF